MIWDSSMVLILSRRFTVCFYGDSLIVSTRRIYRLDREDLFISPQMEKQIGVVHAVYVNYCLNAIMQYLKVAGVITTTTYITTIRTCQIRVLHMLISHIQISLMLHPGDILSLFRAFGPVVWSDLRVSIHGELKLFYYAWLGDVVMFNRVIWLGFNRKTLCKIFETSNNQLLEAQSRTVLGNKYKKAEHVARQKVTADWNHVEWGMSPHLRHALQMILAGRRSETTTGQPNAITQRTRQHWPSYEL